MSADEVLVTAAEATPPPVTLTIDRIEGSVAAEHDYQLFAADYEAVYGLRIEPPDPDAAAAVMANARALIKQYGVGTFRLDPEPV